MPTAPTADTVDACAVAFEAARRRGPAAIGDHLPPPAHPAWAAAAAELVRLDLEYGWAAAAPRPLADYLDAFPALAADPALLGGVCFEEYRQRADRGEDVHPTEYAARFGVDTSGWDAAGRPATAAVSATPPPAGLTWKTMPGSVVAWPAAPAAGPSGARAASGSAVSQHETDSGSAFPVVGDEFAGYALTAELGRGAFARVFLARQEELSDRPVAVKVTSAAADDSATLARLQHANIVPVYSVHRRGPLTAVCMPYLGATTLADVSGELRKSGLPRSGRFLVSTLAQRRSATRAASAADVPLLPDAPADPAPARAGVNTGQLTRLSAASYADAVLWLVARLADGLQHAHERGVVHRDLKPANVLLTDDGQPMLLDFNLSADDHAPGAATAARVGGTLPYMAPEHLAAFADGTGTVDARSDLYALGLIAFELLAGRPAFPTPTAAGIRELLPAMRAQRAGPPPRLRPLNPAVSPAAESVVRTLLAADPAARYQTAADLKADIERHLAYRPLRVAPNPSGRERLVKWGRRHPRLSSAGTLGAVAAGLLVLAGGGAFAWREQARRDRAELRLRDLQSDVARHAADLGAGLADPERLADTYAAGRATLDRYGALTDPDWEGREAVRHLSAADRERLHRELGELAFLLAEVGRRPAAAKAASAAPDADRLGQLAATLAPADDSPRGLFRAAFERYGQRKDADALGLARQAADADPHRPAAWFLLGVVADRLGQVGKAEAAYDTALAVGGDPYRVRLNRGLARLKSRQPQAAAADFAACLALRPDDPTAYINRAVARMDAGDPAGAVADLTAALDRGAPQTRVYFLRARLHRLLNDPAKAAADLATGLRLTPTDPASWVSRALARRAADPKAAVADLDQALALDPEYLPALQSKASVLAEELKDPAGSAAALTRLLALDPRSVPALTGRAVVRARQGDRAGAVADAEGALVVSREPDAVYMAAGAYALLSARHPADKATALRLLTEALRGGFGFQHLATDPELAPLRGDADFERVVAAARRLDPPGR